MTRSNKYSIEYMRMNEIDAYLCQEKTTDLSLIALSLFVALYIDNPVACLIIALSIFKLFILLIFNVIEKTQCETEIQQRVRTRTLQFFIYRFIVFLQLFCLMWILYDITSSQHGTSP